jgi:AraC-like DNA-binding protein
LLRLRLALALERLAGDATDATEATTLSRLALDLGFASHSHFTFTFRRVLGASPSDFRRAASGARVREASKSLGG